MSPKSALPIFSGPIQVNQGKSWLQDLAGSLQISTEGTRKDLVNRIRYHFGQNTHLYMNPNYLGLVINRKPTLESQDGAGVKGYMSYSDITAIHELRYSFLSAPMTLDAIRTSINPLPREEPNNLQETLPKYVENPLGSAGENRRWLVCE